MENTTPDIEALVCFSLPIGGCIPSLVHLAVQYAYENCAQAVYVECHGVTARVLHVDTCVAVQARLREYEDA